MAYIDFHSAAIARIRAESAQHDITNVLFSAGSDVDEETHLSKWIGRAS
jgi:hypothetical protein